MLTIVHDLDNWPADRLNNFKSKNCLFGTINIVKNGDESKLVRSGYKVAFDEGRFEEFW